MPPTLRASRSFLVGAAALTLGIQACGGASARMDEEPGAARLAGEVSRVAVSSASTLGPAGRRALAQADALAVLQQSTLDWLAQDGRLATRSGGLELRLEVDALHLRSPLVTWLFAWLAGPDRLEAQVQVSRSGAALRDLRVTVSSSLAGFGWRDSTERMRRLARRLGRQVAEGL